MKQNACCVFACSPREHFHDHVVVPPVTDQQGGLLIATRCLHYFHGAISVSFQLHIFHHSSNCERRIKIVKNLKRERKLT
jgi:hypothetical protein